MAQQNVLAKWMLAEGYSSSRNALEGGDFAQSGSENVIFRQNKRPRTFKGLTALSPSTGSRQLFNFDFTYAGLNDNGSPARGSVYMIAAGRTLAYIGSGLVYLTGVSLSTTASSTPQMRLLRSGSYIGAGTGPYQLGLGQPNTCDLAIGTYGSGLQVTGQSALTGKLKGTYSAAITRIRSTTGAESNASVTSPVITATASGQWARVTLPLPDSNGQDRWGFYATQSGFGTIGPLLFYVEILESDVSYSRTTSADVVVNNGDQTITSATGAFTSTDIGRAMDITSGAGNLSTYITNINSSTSVEVNATPSFSTVSGTVVITQAVDGVKRSIPLEWSDADLVGGQLAPIDNNPPEAGIFGFSLQDTAAIVGSFGDQDSTVTVDSPGNVIQVSRPGFPESYPADSYLFLPESPTAVLERAADNYVFIFGMNSLCAVTWSGGPTPLDLQVVWNNTGIQTPHNACIADGRLYAITGNGLVRMGENGLPDREWTVDIQNDLEGLTPANTILGYDADSRHVCVMSGSYLWAFNLITEQWSTRLNLTTLVTPIVGNIVSAVTVNGSLKIGVLDGSTFTIYTYDEGDGSTWKIYTSWKNANTMDYKTGTTVYGAFAHDNAGTDVSMAVYGTNRLGEFDLTTPRRTWLQHVPNAGQIVIRPKKIDAKGAKALALYISGTSTSDASAPIELEIAGTQSPVRV